MGSLVLEERMSYHRVIRRNAYDVKVLWLRGKMNSAGVRWSSNEVTSAFVVGKAILNVPVNLHEVSCECPDVVVESSEIPGLDDGSVRVATNDECYRRLLGNGLRWRQSERIPSYPNQSQYQNQLSHVTLH